MNPVNDQERDILNPANPHGNYVPNPDSSMSCETLAQWKVYAEGLKAAHASQGGSTSIRDNYVNGYTKLIADYDQALTAGSCGEIPHIIPQPVTSGGETTGSNLPATSPPTQTGGTTGFLSGVWEWVTKNPLLAGAVAAGLFIFLTDKKKKP